MSKYNICGKVLASDDWMTVDEFYDELKSKLNEIPKNAVNIRVQPDVAINWDEEKDIDTQIIDLQRKIASKSKSIEWSKGCIATEESEIAEMKEELNKLCSQKNIQQTKTLI